MGNNANTTVTGISNAFHPGAPVTNEKRSFIARKNEVVIWLKVAMDDSGSAENR